MQCCGQSLDYPVEASLLLAPFSTLRA